MGTERRFYCPSCGTKIGRKEHDYLTILVRAGTPAPCLSNPECEGDGAAS